MASKKTNEKLLIKVESYLINNKSYNRISVILANKTSFPPN